MGKTVAALCTIALLGIGVRAEAYVLRTDNSGHPVRWTHGVRFVVDPRLPDQLKEPHAIDAVKASLHSYETTLPDVKISLEQDTIIGLGYDADGVIERNSIQMPSDWPFQPEAIAVTVVTVDDSSHEIVDADIALNPNHVFRVLPPLGDPGGPDDIQNAVTHELGHAFGLAHNPEDPQAVMYPTASPGETVKRTLSSDDLAALGQLYDVAPQTGGCNGAGAAPIALFALAGLFLRRRKFVRLAGLAASLLAVVLLPAAAHAAPVATPVLLAHVESSRTLPPSGSGPKLVFTELTMHTDQCLSGSCPSTFTLRVPGGKWSHFEQWVDDAPVPQAGESLGLELAAPDLGLYSFSSAKVFHLADPQDFQRFASLMAAHGATR
jgi:uncharacterized protein (TIGR03382 family)